LGPLGFLGFGLEENAFLLWAVGVYGDAGERRLFAEGFLA